MHPHRCKKFLLIGLSLVVAAACVQASAATYHFRVAAPGVVAPPSEQQPSFGAWDIQSQIFGNPDFDLVAPVSNSTGAYTFTSGDPSIATVSGKVVHLLRAGEVTITATQASTSLYLGGIVQAQLRIDAASPNLSAWSIPAMTFGAPDFDLTAPSSSSPVAFTYSSSDPAIASIAGARVHILKTGTVTITAAQAATSNYFSASTTAQFTVTTPPPPTLVGNGASTAGACASGAVGCSTFNSTTGFQLGAVTFFPGNLHINKISGAASEVYFTATPSSGKYYFEITTQGVSTNQSYFYFDGNYVAVPTGVYGVWADYDAKSAKVYKGGTLVGTLPMSSAKKGFIQLYGEAFANFGQSNFNYAVPAGYRAGLW